ncbi:hypothetical protein LguiB_012376 [Lonicera macranthoides]
MDDPERSARALNVSLLYPRKKLSQLLKALSLSSPLRPTQVLVIPSTLFSDTSYSGMTNKRPMTVSERQRKSKKHCAVGAAKQHGKTIKPVTPTPPEIENDPPSQNEPQCEGNSNPLSTQNDHQNEGPSSSDKGPSGGPIEKSVKFERKKDQSPSVVHSKINVSSQISQKRSGGGLNENQLVDSKFQSYAINGFYPNLKVHIFFIRTPNESPIMPLFYPAVSPGQNNKFSESRMDPKLLSMSPLSGEWFRDLVLQVGHSEIAHATVTFPGNNTPNS